MTLQRWKSTSTILPRTDTSLRCSREGVALTRPSGAGSTRRWGSSSMAPPGLLTLKDLTSNSALRKWSAMCQLRTSCAIFCTVPFANLAMVHLGGRIVSFDYFVAVHNDKWPTAKAVQTALERLGYPVSLASAPDETFSITKGTLGIPVIFEGHPIDLEADIEQATDANDPESLWGYIAKCAAPNFAISNGD